MASFTPAAAGVDLMEVRYTEGELAAMTSPMSSSAASFAEYLYWAERKRAEEDADKTVIASQGWGRLIRYYRNRNDTEEKEKEDVPAVSEKSEKLDAEKNNSVAEFDEYVGMSEHDQELLTARRVLRQAGWATVFYLVTCDILGPFNAPFSIASIGMAPGICLYVLFGVVAFISGVMLHRIWLRLDSARYPITLYGDMCERTVGSWLKYLASFLQCVQLTINVGLICLTNGQSLSQIIAGPHGTGHLCFSVTVLIWALCGMVIGMIRGLGNFSILANASVWLNLMIIFINIGFAARTLPNYTAAFATSGLLPGPVMVSATIPGQPLFIQINGVFNMVFAYGGAMIFPEIMAEMRRPRDFVKGMAVAQLLIISVYLAYGITLYPLEGQFVQAQSYTGLSLYSGQTICNVIGIITGTIAAGLYGNIGLKVIYRLVVEQLLKGPGLMTFRGRIVWSLSVLLYWSVAFVLGSAIPSVGTLTGLLGAMGFFHFTYTFPPLMMLGLDMQIDAALEDEPFTTPGVTPRKIDTWYDFSRWKRGFLAGGRRRLIWKIVNLIFFLTALATAGMGLWATGTDLRRALKVGVATSLGCNSPVG
ncbi:transmembrane amino acid transporter protein-domain-containing protein [Roridomyces roridus]|uniref:Transmembrane amino acid transporter protein-domain-containing protein n=1 Tax=Roridomyces roridus TaxID=1738132 RepID=A0AAD7G2Q9_9AGAR|nr:transmembrane amino acid transporter protein-domain-containing protein [Roridomyces roridus]